jgi:hypothetical protein
VEARSEWRRGSGAAHGMPWAVLGVSSTQQVGAVDQQGMATFVAKSDWATVCNGYMLAYHLLRRGWRLMDARGRST